MKKVQYIFLFFIILCSRMGFSQDVDLSVFVVPDSLKEEAYCIIRNSSTNFEYKSQNEALEKHSIAMTVLDKKGSASANFVYYGDQFRELRKFSGKLYDANGTLLRKFKLSDIVTMEYSLSLSTGAKYYLFECISPVYPYTVQYEYEVVWKKGFLIFPSFFPQPTYNMSVEKADYTLTLPQGVKFRQKFSNLTEKPDITSKNNTMIYKWMVTGLPAVVSEPFSPNIKNLVPWMYLSPESFLYDTVSGEIKDWESYSSWIYGLLKGRDDLPQECKDKILYLTKDAKNDVDKVKILYEHLGRTTRYVSIQLGIGGYQPMLASEVYNVGFGDCKALTFYLKSMLDVVNIPSDYVMIRSDSENKGLLTDYANFHEINHVILRVPLNPDTIWLECTNPKIPFGYIHEGIAGHAAVAAKEEGGKISFLPDYPDSLNLDKNSTVITLMSDGSAEAEVKHEFHMSVYEDYMNLTLLKESELIDILRRGIRLPNANVKTFNIEEHKTRFPNLTVDYAWSTGSYGTKTGNRLFIPVNPFRFSYDWFKKNNRKHDLNLVYGFKNTDQVVLSVPSDFEVESIPSPERYDTPYGRFESSVVYQDSKIYVTQIFKLSRGVHSVDEYEILRSFIERVNKAYTANIVLKKKDIL